MNQQKKGERLLELLKQLKTDVKRAKACEEPILRRRLMAEILFKVEDLETYTELQLITIPSRSNARGARRRASILSHEIASGIEENEADLKLQKTDPKAWLEKHDLSEADASTETEETDITKLFNERNDS